MSLHSRSSSPELLIPSSSRCRFLRRCSTTGPFPVLVRAAGSDPTLLLKLVLCVGSGDTQAAALFLCRHGFCHTSAESTVNSSKAFCALESEATFHHPHTLTFLPSFLLCHARPFHASVLILTSKHTDRLSFLCFCIILMQTHVIISHFWHHLSLCFSLEFLVSMLS